MINPFYDLGAMVTMNTDILFENLHQGFRITVGATASLLETLQDPQRRSQTLGELQTELSQKAEEWAAKGEITEQEGRRIAEEWFQRFRNSQTPSSSTYNTDTSYPDEPVPTPERNLKAEILELTAQISSLREELEELRDAE